MGAVVVNYNAGEVLARCLASLQDNGVTDIVVVDNGSTDGSTALVEAPEAPCRLVQSPRNGGYGAGANLGARCSRRELLFICNPDLVVEPDAIERLVQALDGDHGDAAVAGPMLLETDGSVDPSGRTFPDLGDTLGHGFVGLFWHDNPWTRRYRLLGDEQHRARNADWVSGAGFLVRGDAYEAVAGFDEAYFMYVEDVDLCWRLHPRAGASSTSRRHGQSMSRGARRHREPYRMLAAHHRSILRFAARSTKGRRRLLLPACGGRARRPVRARVLGAIPRAGLRPQGVVGGHVARQRSSEASGPGGTTAG